MRIVDLLSEPEFCDAGHLRTNSAALVGLEGAHLGRPVHCTEPGSDHKIRTGHSLCQGQERTHPTRFGDSQKQTHRRSRLEGGYGQRRRSSRTLFPKNPLERSPRALLPPKLEEVDGARPAWNGRNGHTDKDALLLGLGDFCIAFPTDGVCICTLWERRRSLTVGQEWIAAGEFHRNVPLVVLLRENRPNITRLCRRIDAGFWKVAPTVRRHCRIPRRRNVLCG
mmetsp:Transcript_11534/g.29190  ORF Transcript_11534/g.29190 Transcript_11534/m.29190 type:complete len:224 (-) Transcript_11534:672-1343(-)